MRTPVPARVALFAHFADQGGGATPLLELIGDEPGTVFSY
jgi:hypothetical protein